MQPQGRPSPAGGSPQSGRARAATPERHTRVVPALAAVIVAAGLQFTLAAPADAQSAVEATRKKQDAAQRQLTDNDRKAAELQAEMARLRQDQEQLRAELVQTARLIQASEAQLSAIEQRRQELGEQEGVVRGSLEARHGQLSKLLAAMQRMGRNPPPVMITRREDALAMIRSAMLVGAAFPELREQASFLAGQLGELVAIRTRIETESEKLRAETQRLNESRVRLAALIDQRKQSESERQAELAQVRKLATEAARRVTETAKDLDELLANTDKLDKPVADNTALGAYDRRVAAEPAPAPGAPPATQPTTRTVTTAEVRPPQPEVPFKPTPPQQQAALTPPPRPAEPPRVPVTKAEPGAVLAPGERVAMRIPERLEPKLPFAQARGRLLLPAQGSRVVNFGEKTQRGPFEGIAISTRHGAQVTAPCDGWIVYAGEFRSYGQVLIINAGGGYHVLLANLFQLDAAPGQFVSMGEPVGTMGPAPKTAQGRTQDNAPVLYVEFRKDQKAINPEPWWAEPPRKNAAAEGDQDRLPQFTRG